MLAYTAVELSTIRATCCEGRLLGASSAYTGTSPPSAAFVSDCCCCCCCCWGGHATFPFTYSPFNQCTINNGPREPPSKLLKVWTPVMHLSVPRHRLSFIGSRAFSVADPTVWNSLPDSLQNSALSSSNFRQLVKTNFFNRYSAHSAQYRCCMTLRYIKYTIDIDIDIDKALRIKN